MSYPQLSEKPNAKQIDHIYEQRLRQFTDGGQYADLNLPRFYTTASKQIDNIKVYEVKGITRPLFKDIIGKVEFEKEAHVGDNFGPSWKTFWFEFKIAVPEEWANEKEVWLQWDSSSEAMIYDSDGLPLQAFTGGDRNDFILPSKLRTKEHIVYVEMACNGMFGVGMNSDISPPDPNRYFRLNNVSLIVPNPKARQLRIDFWIISDAAREFPGGTSQKYRARQVATEIMDAFDHNDVKSLDKCLKIAETYLGPDAHSHKVYDTNPLNKVDVYGIGNCHIDSAWLWPLAETRRKVVRSWTTQLNLLERYPEYQFVASQMQQFKWLEDDHPEVFAQLSEAVDLGRFVPIGGSWVEHDTNIPHPESLVRQFFVGQRFLQSHFNHRASTFWLPDTFGYSSQIPQLCRLAGLPFFLTQKLSWNNINSFPNTSFNWVGLDGSQVLVHMPPDDTYTADANFGDVQRSLSNHKNLTSHQAGLLCYGKGDGGGGPLPDMLEKLRRCRGLSNTVGLLPTVDLQTKRHTVNSFFTDLLKNSNEGKNLPTWEGELYFEFHRGTYTSQALVKKLMRGSEILLHDVEYFATLASLYATNDEYKYPVKEIEALWQDVLLCQFHDILPGSCIGMVYYDEVHPALRNVIKKGTKLVEDAIKFLTGSKGSGSDKELVLLNTLPWARSGVYKISKSLTSQTSDMIHLQKSTPKSQYVYAQTTKSNHLSPVSSSTVIKYPAKVIQVSDDVIELSNGQYTATFTKGTITSIYDHKHDFEIINQNSSGLEYILLRDTPLNWQAWDTEVYSGDVITTVPPTSITINDKGPLRASVLLEHKISDKSVIKTIVSLDAMIDSVTSAPLTFSCHATWFESRTFLKVQLPTTINSPNASHETQFGYTTRPTHTNTTWDVAKFETVHHKFQNLSNSSHSVTVVNDCKYGGGVRGKIITLSLLRGPREPDPDADKGEHKFKFGILGGYSGLGESTRAGFEFNYPLWPTVADKDRNHGEIDIVGHHELTPIKDFARFISVSSTSNSLVLSNLKRLEDDFSKKKLSSVLNESTNRKEKTQSIVVRLYESLGGFSSGKVVVRPPEDLNLVDVFSVNLLEDELAKLPFEKNADRAFEVPVNAREFEVLSLKFVFK